MKRTRSLQDTPEALTEMSQRAIPLKKKKTDRNKENEWYPHLSEGITCEQWNEIFDYSGVNPLSIQMILDQLRHEVGGKHPHNTPSLYSDYKQWAKDGYQQQQAHDLVIKAVVNRIQHEKKLNPSLRLFAVGVCTCGMARLIQEVLQSYHQPVIPIDPCMSPLRLDEIQALQHVIDATPAISVIQAVTLTQAIVIPSAIPNPTSYSLQADPSSFLITIDESNSPLPIEEQKEESNYLSSEYDPALSPLLPSRPDDLFLKHPTPANTPLKQKEFPISPINVFDLSPPLASRQSSSIEAEEIDIDQAFRDDQIIHAQEEEKEEEEPFVLIELPEREERVPEEVIEVAPEEKKEEAPLSIIEMLRLSSQSSSLWRIEKIPDTAFSPDVSEDDTTSQFSCLHILCNILQHQKPQDWNHELLVEIYKIIHQPNKDHLLTIFEGIVQSWVIELFAGALNRVQESNQVITYDIYYSIQGKRRKQN